MPPFSHLDALSVDALFWLRARFAAAPAAPALSTVAIIAIDEETYRRAPFSELPSALWTPELAQVLGGALESGAKVVGLDVIYATSGERVARGFDKPFLTVLRTGAAAGKIVLGKVQHSTKPILPNIAQRFAVGGEGNIRAVNLLTDADGIVRRMPLLFGREGGGTEPAFALALAARALGVAPRRDAAGRIWLGAHPVPGTVRRGFLLDFDAGGTHPAV